MNLLELEAELEELLNSLTEEQRQIFEEEIGSELWFSPEHELMESINLLKELRK